jgi:DNA-binding Xre family transcriptional regulator
MLQFSIKKVCDARGITKVYRFLTKNGFLPTTASKLSKGDVEYLRLEYIEKLCSLLNCVPNDLFEWVPNSRAEDKPDHPLQAIRQSEIINLTETLKSLPMSKIKEVESLIASLK